MFKFSACTGHKSGENWKHATWSLWMSDCTTMLTSMGKMAGASFSTMSCVHRHNVQSWSCILNTVRVHLKVEWRWWHDVPHRCVQLLPWLRGRRVRSPTRRASSPIGHRCGAWWSVWSVCQSALWRHLHHWTRFCWLRLLLLSHPVCQGKSGRFFFKHSFFYVPFGRRILHVTVLKFSATWAANFSLHGLT